MQPEPFGIEPRFTNLRIRGFDAATTGLYRDGLVLSNPGFAVSYNLEPWGAERIEVPRGPASTLYGQVNPGGLVNYISKLPAREPLRVLDLEFGNHDRVQGRFDLAGPLGEKFAYRVTGLVRDAETQIDFVPFDRVYLAPALTWEPSPGTRLTVLGFHQQDDTMNSQALPAPGTLEANPNGEVPIERFTGEPDVDAVDRTEFALGYLFEHEASDSITVRQRLRVHDLDLNDTVVFSNGIAADLRTIDRGVFGNFGEIEALTLDNQVQAHFTHGSFEHTLLIGVDYQDIDARSKQSFGAAPSIDIFDPVYGAPVTLPAPFRDDVIEREQLGVYVQDQIRFAGRWILSGGLRYDDAAAETESRLTGVTTKQDDKEVTTRVGLVYVSELGLAPYFSYAESFLPSSGTDAAGRPFEPEFGRQFELGVKYQPPGTRSFLTAAVFEVERRDVVETDPATFLQVQTGEIRSRGVELEAVASFDFGLDLLASYTYLDTEITESANPLEIGNRLRQIPDHMASLWAAYRFRRGGLPGLELGAGVRYQGENFGDNRNSVEVPDYTLADASVHYQWRALRLGLNVHNVFDNEHAASCFVRGGANFCTFGETRTVRGTIGVRW